MEVNQKYKIKATVISPLSIGQGGEKDWVEGIDYIRDEGVLYHLSLQMMVEAGIPVDKVSALYASGRTEEIRSVLIGKLDDIHDFAMEMPVGSSNPVKTFYYNQVTRKYTLFGSSLKGAIRSALFHSLTKQTTTAELRDKRGGLNEYVFGKMKDGSDLMRFIRVGDFDFDETYLINTKIYNLHLDGSSWIGGWKHGAKETDIKFRSKGFNTVYECLKPGETSEEGYLMISPLLYELVQTPINFKDQKDTLLSGNPIKQLFQCINESTLDYLNKEIRFFEEYPEGEHSDGILKSLRDYLEITSSCLEEGNRECLIKMAAGTGFHSITGDWQYKDYTDTGDNFRTHKKQYKSRKIACYAGNYTPMGFLKLETLD